MRFRHIFLIATLLCPVVAFAIGNDSILRNFVVSGQQAYFVAAPRAGAVELWTTDGTPDGTRRVADLGGGATVTQMVAFQSGVAFFAVTQQQLTLWRADGDEAVPVIQFPREVADMMIVRDGRLIFSLTRWGPAERHGLWSSDGTAQRTYLIASLPNVSSTAVTAGNLIFILLGNSYDSSRELWRSDGTANGTFSLGPGRGVLGRAGAFALFRGPGGLWRSGGTPETTSLLSGIAALEIVNADNVAYIGSREPLVWRTDGTPSGTMPLFYDGPGHIVRGIVAAGENLYFATEYAYYFHEVKSGQSTLVTFVEERAAWVDGRFFFGSHERGLFVSTDPKLPAVRLTGHFYSDRDLVPFGKSLLFSSYDDVHGIEPWITDGTPEGTVMLANVRPETSLRGSVLDAETGKPVPGVYLVVSGPLCCEQYTQRPDDDGRFVFEGLHDGDYTLSVKTEANDYVPWHSEEIHVNGADVNGIDILVRRGAGLSGRVVDHRGVPVKGMLLSLVTSGQQLDVFTGDDGRYATSRTLDPRTAWIVRTTDARVDRKQPAPAYSGILYEGIACWSGCDPQSQGAPVVVNAGEIRTGVDFVVAPLGKIRGRVLDALTGRPLTSGVEISSRGAYGLSRYEEVATPTSTGEYVLRAGDGGASVTASFGGDYAYDNAWIGPIFVTPGMSVSGYDIRAQPRGARVRGRVTGVRSGKPAAGISVRVDSRDILTVTDSDGRYETPPVLTAGKYTVQTLAMWWASAASGSVSVSGTEIAEVDLQVDELSAVSGIVRDAATRQPLAGARVQLVDSDGRIAGRSSVSDATGSYSLPAPAGSYVARAVKGGWYLDSLPITLSGKLNDVSAADFALEPACRPSIRSPQPVFPAEGGTGRIALSATCSACTFSSSPFLHLPASCGKPGAVTYVVEPNPGPARTGWVVVPGGAMEVRQEGGLTRSAGR